MNSTVRQARQPRRMPQRLATGAAGVVLVLVPAGASASSADMSALSEVRESVSASGGSPLGAAIPVSAEPVPQSQDEDRSKQDVTSDRISVAAIAAVGGAAMLVISGVVSWVQRRRAARDRS
ncbi:hypothetical protein [Bounagaea algeriensis]